MKSEAVAVMERCEFLGGISEEACSLTRPYGSRALRDAADAVSGWMRAAGMEVRRDAIMNLIGRYEGTGQKTLVLGSHLDTVRDAGKYDGPLGVLVALACVQRLHDRGERLPFSIELVAFSDEEGLRFGTTFLGSSVYAGTFDSRLLSLRDGEGVPLTEAVRDFGGDPEALPRDGRGAEDLLGYCEVHIEQGPVLQEVNLPVGVVTAINGQSRIGVGFTGRAGHAGTVPMEARKDALCAASEFVLTVEASCAAHSGAVATVGEISVLPGASNVIPAEAHLSLDLRHPDDGKRAQLRDHLKTKAAEIAASRSCEYSWRVRQETSAVRIDSRLRSLLERAVQDSGVPLHRLASGAGHDAAEMAALTPVAMLFVRCRDGISHTPEESVKEEDANVAIEVMDRFLRLAAEPVGPTGTL